MSGGRRWSLVRRQRTILILSLTGVALLLGLGGAWYIQDFTERTSDRVLRASVNAISETVALEGGAINLEVPSDAFGMLEDSARDNVYYSVRSGGDVITGYADFPASPAVPPPEETLYRYDTYLGQPVRVATQARLLTGNRHPVVIEVAETLDERSALAHRMLLGLGGLEAALVVIAALLIGPAIRWGLVPLTALRSAIDERQDGRRGFAALDQDQAPLELRDLVRTFNTMLERLDRATRRIREFTADASHQMRTPLTALRTNLHLALQRERSEDERHEALLEIDAATLRLQRLLTQLLGLARSDAAARDAVPEANLYELAAEAARDLAPRAIEAGMELHLDGDPGTSAMVPPFVVVEMLSNLIDNAVRYGRPGKQVSLDVHRHTGLPVIEIADDGPGIPAEHRDAVFERFNRLSRDRDLPGSGLGLAIVRSLADTAGATIELGDAHGGRGLLVRLTFLPPRKVDESHAR